MKLVTTTLALFLFSFISAFSQGKISGKVLHNAIPAEHATVSLLKAGDSAIVKVTVTTKEGVYHFENIPAAQYLVMVTSVGYQKYFSRIIDLPSQQTLSQADIILLPVSKELADVKVTAKRPLIEQRIDRTIVNVEASITNVGTSALEVLEKSPGITVDRDGNISLKGKQGVIVMVDGRPTHLGGADLANLLRNMSSAQLDQIEIMTNPPAKYDAAGSAGVINIKSKKILTAGFNGSVSLGYSQGRYPKTNEGFNFNYRNAKVNLYTNLSHNFQKRYSILKIDRNIFNSNTNDVEKIFNQQANMLQRNNTFNGIVGIDFFASKKTTFGAVLNLNSRNNLNINSSSINISDAAKNLESVTNALVNNEGEWKSTGLNVNFRRLIGKNGKELTADFDMLNYRTGTDVLMVNSYLDAAGNNISKSDTLVGDLPQVIKVHGGRIDYLHPFKKGARFEAGLKSSIVETDNNAGYDSISNGVIVHDIYRSNHFIYQENINAAYVNLSGPLSKKINVQLGLRLENTNAKGRQKSTGEQFDRHYTQLFPTAYFQYQANEKNNFGANFGRRVRRPSYQSLNPFIRFIDRYTFSQGNPNLRPSISNNIELSHNWKKMVTTTLNYTVEKDIIQEVIQQKGQEAYNMPSNVSLLKQFGVSVNTNIPVTKWWTSNVNFNAYRDNYSGVINNVDVHFKANSFMVSGTQQIKLNPTTTAELNGGWRTGRLEGVLRVRSIGLLGVGISKQVWKGKGTFRLSARDIFHTQRMRGSTKYGNVDFAMTQFGDTRIVTAGFSYNFSKGKKIAPVKRTDGSSTDEKGRVGQ